MHKKKIQLFDVINVALVFLITAITIYPLYFCVIASFSSPTQVAAGNTLLWIKDFTLDIYGFVLKESRLWVGYQNSIMYLILGTLYNLLLTIPAAYVLTKKYLPFRNIITWFFFITMYVSGGTIPNYLLRKDLNLIDNPLVLIIGVGVSCYNLIVTRQYFDTNIPAEIYEAAIIDGASEGKCFTGIAVPLAKPIIAVMTLYYGIGHWNSYYSALIYIRKQDYYPLQLILRNILLENQLAVTSMENADANTMQYLAYRAQMAEGMKYAIVFIASAPLLIAYPFVQKYFTKGIMVGGVKG